MTNVLEQLSNINYRPSSPISYSPNIGMIGCGGITRYQLKAYLEAGFRVTSLCDLDTTKADLRRAEFFPQASVHQDYRQLLADDSIEVVDITTHPPQRPPLIEAALRAGKHVLSQKPFVLDLDEGMRLIELADKCGRQLAINQNGRWAPHFSYARQVVSSEIIGDVFGVHLSCHWDHTWVKGTEFENVKHLILYDYAVHWFDIVCCLLKGKEATRVFASTARVPNQQLMPNLLGQALIEFDGAQSTLAFDASVPAGSQDRTYLAGTRGSLFSVGAGNQDQRLSVSVPAGDWTPKLIGKWFPDAFHGTMGELLCAIEERRESTINALDNLRSLELCFAAIKSADTGLPVVPGSVRQLPN